ncbi:hypothetical protein [Nocardia lijiangensis]|uniref:hypothetical protein n=1 Tax=Nocardia lijiangensis TaxID=299618 RepID=UPI003D74B6DB
MTAVAAAFGADHVTEIPEVTSGFSTAFLGTAVIALAGAGIAVVTMRAQATESVPEQV